MDEKTPQRFKLLSPEEFNRLSPEEKMSYLAAAILTIGQPRRESIEARVDPIPSAHPSAGALDDKPDT